jgi:hypothetical protein
MNLQSQTEAVRCAHGSSIRPQRRRRARESLPRFLEPGDVIDAESGMTMDDLDTILSFVSDFPSSD